MSCPKCAVGFLFGNLAYDLGYIYTCDSCGYCEIKNQFRPPEPFDPETLTRLDWLKPMIFPHRIADDEIDDLDDEIEGEELLSLAIRHRLKANWASLDADGCLAISGQDIGPKVEHFLALTKMSFHTPSHNNQKQLCLSNFGAGIRASMVHSVGLTSC